MIGNPLLSQLHGTCTAIRHLFHSLWNDKPIPWGMSKMCRSGTYCSHLSGRALQFLSSEIGSHFSTQEELFCSKAELEPNISLLAVILFLLNFFPCLFRTPWRPGTALYLTYSDGKCIFFSPRNENLGGKYLFSVSVSSGKKTKKPNLGIRHLSFCRVNEKRFSIWNHLFRDFQSPQN